MKLTVEVSGAEAIRAHFAKLDGATKLQALAKTAVEVERYVHQQADRHTQTGALVQSIYSRRIDGGYEIGHDLQRAKHAVFVHWGTRAHVIEPDKKRILRWPAGGVFAFARKVNHPGNAPDKWMERAAHLAPRRFAQHVEQLLKGA